MIFYRHLNYADISPKALLGVNHGVSGMSGFTTQHQKPLRLKNSAGQIVTNLVISSSLKIKKVSSHMYNYLVILVVISLGSLVSCGGGGGGSGSGRALELGYNGTWRLSCEPNPIPLPSAIETPFVDFELTITAKDTLEANIRRYEDSDCTDVQLPATIEAKGTIRFLNEVMADDGTIAIEVNISNVAIVDNPLISVLIPSDLVSSEYFTIFQLNGDQILFSGFGLIEEDRSITLLPDIPFTRI